jgi:hypothetical protein
MRKVLYDMQLAESLVEVEYDKYRTNEERQKLYDAVFAKYDITQAKYDSSLVWYGKNMDKYMNIYKAVLKDIEANIASMEDVKQDALSGDISLQDSLDLWIQKEGFTFKPTPAFNQLVFDIKPQTPYISGNSYVIEFNVWGVSSRIQEKPRLKLSAVQQDTIVYFDSEISDDGKKMFTLKTIDSLQVNRIFGYIFMNNAKPAHQVYIDDIKLMKYNKPLLPEEETLEVDLAPSE